MIDEEDWDGVVELATHQVGLMPGYTEPDSPYIALARAEEARGNRDDAVAALRRFWRGGGYDPDTLTRLAAWHREAGRTEEAIEVLSTVNLVDPLDHALHGTLGELLLEAERPAEALREFTVALSMNPHDKATAYYRLASAHHALGERDASRDALLLALDVAPNYRPAQRLLLELMRADSGSEPKQQ